MDNVVIPQSSMGNGGNDSPAATNPYNAGPHYAMMGTGCWTWQASAHELLHTLGAVQGSAPNATRFGHCWDDQDIMCYNDGGIPNPPGGLVNVCAGAPENQFDCNGNCGRATAPAPVQLWDCNGTGAQNWQAQANGTLRNPRSGRCLATTGGSSADGTRLVIWDCATSANQVWRLPA